MKYSLQSCEKKHYLEEGYLIRKNIFKFEEVLLMNKALERATSKALALSDEGQNYYLDGKRFVDFKHMTVQFENELKEKVIKVIEPAHHLDKHLEVVIKDQRILDPIKGIIGQDEISLWTDKLNLKRPMIGSGFGWHQDSPYWMHDSQDVSLLPNVYISLDQADKENGCFSVIPRSHLEGCLPGTKNDTQLGGFYTDPLSFSAENEVLLELSAGSLVFFNPHIVHGSKPNKSLKQRRAYIITYQPGGLPALKSKEIYNIP
jgi:ectoine hydroxylase-related dioxygenase (phytanoyl-CoA dioxygenase family)